MQTREGVTSIKEDYAWEGTKKSRPGQEAVKGSNQNRVPVN